MRLFSENCPVKCPQPTTANGWRKRWLTLAVALVLAACTSVQTTRPGAVGVEREQMMSLSASEVNNASAKAYRDTLNQARAKGALNTDPQLLSRVRGIANRLIPATAAFRSDAPGWKWEVNVISVKELNAWCMPGGKIAVYSGLPNTLRLTDDELAAVMGHEIAHALREHGRERASKAAVTNMGVNIVGNVVGAMTGIGGAAVDLTGLMANVMFTLPNSREAEIEADRIGVELAARAGYDPRAAMSLWAKMGRASQGQPPEWLSTHPANESRQQDLARYAERVMPLYEAAHR